MELAAETTVVNMKLQLGFSNIVSLCQSKQHHLIFRDVILLFAQHSNHDKLGSQCNANIHCIQRSTNIFIIHLVLTKYVPVVFRTTMLTMTASDKHVQSKPSTTGNLSVSVHVDRHHNVTTCSPCVCPRRHRSDVGQSQWRHPPVSSADDDDSVLTCPR